MNIDIQKTYHLLLTPEELRLVCKALGGRLKQNEIAAAKELDTRIAQIRIANGKSDAVELQKLEENLLKASS